MKRNGLLISILLTLLFGGLYYYFAFPVLNITNIGFWIFVALIIIMFVVFNSIFCLKVRFQDLIMKKKNYKYNNKIEMSALILFIPLIIVGILVVNIAMSPLFFSNKYYKRITVSLDSEFTSSVKEVDFNKIPLLDRASSEKLGDRTMGQMSELVSQFDVSNMYTQINYNDEILRVTPLEYNGWIKWLTNRKNGIKGYITVDSVDGEAKHVKLDKGMK